MAGKRDHLFPATSISRSASLATGATGSAPQRMASFESLSAHPLLSSQPSYTASVSADLAQEVSATPPKYTPYVPRQRGAPTAATTGATLQSSAVAVASPPHNGGDAKSKLQLMSLKAVAQGGGLESGSVGWAILERLVSEGDHGPEWASIHEAIGVGKATLLLPLELLHSSDHITAELVKDHVVLCNGASRDDSPIITLSGLRGQLDQHELVIRSTILPSSQTYQKLLSVPSRSYALSCLPPLPVISSSTSTPYPKFAVPNYITSLPLPSHPTLGKPPLPPRPGARASPIVAPSRLPNPFSFFGKAVPTPLAASSSTPASTERETVIEVPAFIVDKRVVMKDIGKSLTKALRTEVKDMLSGASVPSAIADRVQGFIAMHQPLIKATKKAAQPNQNSSLMHPAYEVNPRMDEAEELGQAFQEFYDVIENDLHATSSPKLSRRRQEGSVDDEKDREKRERDQEKSEAKIRDILEVIERTVCTLLYDRIFSPETADDASHDEALSSRIAALNATDITLAHLGVEVDRYTIEVDAVVAACGQMLGNLSACRSPADKSALLVAAHKIIVDGLSRLPPLRLKSEAEMSKQQTPQSSQVMSPTTPTASTILRTGSEKPDDVAPTPRASHFASAPTPAVITSPAEETEPSPAEDAPSPIPSPGLAPDTLQVRPGSPLLTISPPPEREPTVVSGDILLPLLIYSVMKSNPDRLVSHLLYLQRFRNSTFGGEESYCLCNFLAVAEFLENVDLAGLGLSGPEGAVPSTASLSPIAVARGGVDPSSPPPPPASIRGRVEQQVDALAGSATKVISGVTGVVDTSFGVLRSFLPGGPDSVVGTPAVNADQNAAPWNAIRPGFGILRRESGFSIASIAASLPGAGRERARSMLRGTEETGQQMVERPASRGSLYVAPDDSSEDGEEDDEEGSAEESEADETHDTRSIRSFGSMMSDRRQAISRKSLSDRLASMPGLNRDGTKSSPPPSRPSSILVPDTKQSPPPSRRSSLLPATHASPMLRSDSLLPPLPSPPASGTLAETSSHVTTNLSLAPPIQRFLDCSEDDLRMSEIRELLKDYRRLADGIRAAGGFSTS